MNVRDQSKVAYQTSGVEERSKPTGSRQFKGKNMPQGNKMEKKSVSKKQVSKMIKKSEKKDEKKDKKMMKGMYKKKEMSMISDERIKKHGEKKGRRYE